MVEIFTGTASAVKIAINRHLKNHSELEIASIGYSTQLITATSVLHYALVAFKEKSPGTA